MIDKKASVGMEKMIWATITVVLVFALMVVILYDWGAVLSSDGVNLLTEYGGAFNSTNRTISALKDTGNQSLTELFGNEITVKDFGLIYEGAKGVMSTFSTIVFNFPLILAEFLVFIGIPTWILGVIGTMIVISIAIVLIKAFASGGREI